jgi:endonuclease YncB( thermonuclease family)
MSRSYQPIRLLLLTLAATSIFSFAHSKDFVLEGRVERVMDGDTVELITSNSTKVKIRLLGIDAPESRQFFGQESTENLKRLGEKKRVKAFCVGSDRYRRSLCKIVIDDLDLNLEQIKRGLAWHYKAYIASQSKHDQRSYATAEIHAQNSRLGLWGHEVRVPPWEYRNGVTGPDGRVSDSELLGVIKMSRSKICHRPGGRYYANTTNFSSFASIDDCLNSGGRLPKSR